MSYPTIREVVVTNGTDTRTLTILNVDGQPKLHDPADVNMDSLTVLAGSTDSDVQDVLTDGFEIA